MRGQPGGGNRLAGVLVGLLVFLGTALAVRFARDRLGVEVGPLVAVAALLVAVVVALSRRR